ncbi:hypothetical protein QAD02_010962 [Eretmocerus hayati]|uniref:Uncharacterized protein n=1 Tax=Eretmocerus hayati TaxID=131215 RepID=A0ACC2NX45_9HYME|nr:hypothetical protein QAD02_010962 [Eretmocerus hayati]
MSTNQDDDGGFVVKVRGLPWSTTVEEVLKFFGDCNILNGKNGIHMTMSKEGRPSGEAYIELEAEQDVQNACKKDRDHIGHRYIEVFRAKRGEMEWVVKRSGQNIDSAMDDGCVRLRGLPFGCSKEEIAQFFSGLEIMPNGISLPTDNTGRSTGEAYVQFVNKDVAERALQKHKEKIGHRYIEIFRSSLSEIRSSNSGKMRGGPMSGGGYNQRPAPYDRGSRFGGMNRYNNGNRGSGRGDRRDYDDGPGWNDRGNYSRGNNMGGGMRNRGDMDMKRGGNYGGGRNDEWMHGGLLEGHCIHMRGLPFRATEEDIADFFRPLMPVNIHLIMESSGRASGEADVEFSTHEEAVKAMSKDKSHMSHRYIELFLNSTPRRGMGGGGGGNMGGRGMGGGNMGGRGMNCDDMDDMGMGGGRGMGGGNMGGRGMGGGNMGGRGMNCDDMDDMGMGGGRGMGGGNMGGRGMGGGNMGGGNMGGGNMGGRGMNCDDMDDMGMGGGRGMGGGGGNMGGRGMGGGNMGGRGMGGNDMGGGNMGGGNMGGRGMGGGGGGNNGNGMHGGGNYGGGMGNNYRGGY